MSIFVSIASYRDPECPLTVKSLFENANNPDLITVGLCQQNDADDIDCVEQKYINKIKVIRISHFQAKGPTYARYLCSTLISDEQYFLQVDSHTRFIKDWDIKLIAMLSKLKNMGIEKPIISHYPPEYDYKSKEVPHICKSFFNDRGMISFLGANNLEPSETPKINAYIAAGMMFCEIKAIKEVPFDPNLDNLFVGEEILHSARFWTNGYDIYSPTENVIFHYYTRTGLPKFWDLKSIINENVDRSDTISHEKVKIILKLIKNTNDINNTNYGLGTVRSLEDYYNFCGINIDTRKVTKNFCTGENDEDTASFAYNALVNHTLVNDTFISRNINYIVLFLIVLLFICHWKL